MNSYAGRVAAFILAVVFGIIGVIALIAWISGYDKTSGGEVAVVRNGGPFDNHKVRQVIDPASGLTYTGMFSDVHKYPSTQRFYTISANPNEGDMKGVDVVQVPTADGVNVGIEGTFYFEFNTNHSALKDFDTKFGTRTFGGKHPYEGTAGIENFEASVLRPVIDNDLREQIGQTACADLVSSCALVQNQGKQTIANASQGKQTVSKIIDIQNRLNASFVTDLKDNLGGNYITGVKFILRGVKLPDKVQNAVDDAQAAFGAVSQSEAHVKQASLDAQANEIRQKGYQKCPTCARIDAIKALPRGITALGGNGFAVGVK